MNTLTTLRQPEAIDCVALLETAKGAELHLRGTSGAILRLPLANASHDRSLEALVLMAGAIGEPGLQLN